MFELEYNTTIEQPPEVIFERLINIDEYPEWLPPSRIFIDCKQTSPGPVEAGTTFVDKTSAGIFQGEVVTLEKPHKVIFHNRLRWLGLPVMESFPSYELKAAADGTKVRHFGHGRAFGLFKLFEGYFEKLAKEERHRTLRLLKQSFEN